MNPIQTPILVAAALFAASPCLSQTFVVNTTNDTADAMPGDGVAADASGRVSLRAAIQEANALAPMTPVRIRLQPNLRYVLTMAGAGEDGALSGDLDVTGRVHLFGLGATLDAAGLDRVLDVQMGASLEIFDCNLIGGAVTDESGGAIRSVGSLRVVSSTISDCSAIGTGASGGAVFNDGGTMRSHSSGYWRNSATRAGGAIEANAGTTALFRCDFGDNTTGAMPGNGGGLHLTGAGDVSVVRCLFDGNSAAREGGALWNSASGTMVVSRCRIVDNEAVGSAADDGGGGLFNDGGVCMVSDSQFVRNRATTGSGSGGGAFNLGGILGFVNCEFEGNTSNRAGGGIEAVDGMTGLMGCLLTQNATGSSPGNGGGLHLTGMGEVFAQTCMFDANFASAEGGAMWNSSGGTMHVSDSAFFDNVASGDAADQGGGGLFNAGGQMAVRTSWFVANAADGASGSGGGLLNDGGSLWIEDCLLRDNWSLRAGGGIEANVGTTQVLACTFVRNATGASPGNGGGLHLTGAGTVDLAACLLVRNSADNEGGGLWNSSTGMMTATGTFLVDNQSPTGPNAFNDGGTFMLNGQPVQ